MYQEISPENELELAMAIGDADSGDTIVVHNEGMWEFGERLKSHMCPGKELTFRVEGSDLKAEVQSLRETIRGIKKEVTVQSQAIEALAKAWQKTFRPDGTVKDLC